MSFMKYKEAFELEIEQSALIPYTTDKQARSIASSVSRYGKAHNKVFFTRRFLNKKNGTTGVKVWRVE